MSDNSKSKKFIIIMIISVVVLITLFGSAYAFFNYTRTSESDNKLTTGSLYFDFIEGDSISLTNQFPTASYTSAVDEQGDDGEISLDITAYTTLSSGMNYSIYAIVGDEDPDRERLFDAVMSIQAEEGHSATGFTFTPVNNVTLDFTNNDEILIGTGTVDSTASSNDLETIIFRMWVDSNKMLVSSTTNRSTQAEGNPSLGVMSKSTSKVGRYMTNTSEMTNVYLYPATDTTRYVYTTNEFDNAYYSIKFKVVAYNN